MGKLAVEGEMRGQAGCVTFAVGASRLHWGHWVDGASQVDTAQQARFELPCGIDAVLSSRFRCARLAGDPLETGIYGVGCSGSLE